MIEPERGSLKNYETQTFNETDFTEATTGVVGKYAAEQLFDFGAADTEMLSRDEYKDLLVKEYGGELTQEEFDQLLHFEFQQSLEGNPPIEENFSPDEELSEIKHLPKNEKREALSDFKDKLARQRKAWATCQRFIERSIEFDHDVPKQTLETWVGVFGMEYGFDVNHMDIAEEMIDGYYENRQKALDFRKKFPDNTELVSELTGMSFGKDEQFDISIGPMSIDIGMSGENIAKIREPETGEKLKGTGKVNAGFATYSPEHDVHAIAINQDIWSQNTKAAISTRENIVGHEYEHLKNIIFREVFESRQNIESLKEKHYEEDEEIDKVFIENTLDDFRSKAYEKVKDEITAMLQNKEVSTLQGELEPLFLRNEESLYEYLGGLRNLEVGDTAEEKKLFTETADRILVKEYHQKIKDAVDAYAELENSGHSTQEAIALLTDKPLDEWPKTVKRLQEHQQ